MIRMWICYDGVEAPAYWIRNDAIPGEGLQLSCDWEGQDGPEDLTMHSTSDGCLQYWKQTALKTMALIHKK